ncbi:MAG: hypothetical protein M0T78_02210 [Actinomycetota bacterium]|nr:hypothetical protein [Actinomycetota bacterium]
MTTVAAHAPLGLGLLLNTPHVTNYNSGGVVANDVIGRLVGNLMIKVTKR